MNSKILAQVIRGETVESIHRGHLIVMDGDGKEIFTIGNPDFVTFFRSAAKPFQAIPFLLSGAPERFGFLENEIALACASHSGEPRHVALAKSMLARAGFTVEDLECGAHAPLGGGAARALFRSGSAPSALHNNCSGKHAGMLAVARHLGEVPQGYVAPMHPVQLRIRAILEELIAAPISPDATAIDGCSVPTWAVPLSSLAQAFSRLATGEGLSSSRHAAARRLMQAAMREPFYVAGEGRACTRMMQLVEGHAFVKTGAEGVYCAAIPDMGLGIALKVDDGAGRAAECAVASVLQTVMSEYATELRPVAYAGLTNVRGVGVGEVRPSAELLRALERLST